MKTRIKNATVGDIINFSCFLISIILAVVGFILPPTGVIDSSVLLVIGELGFFSTVTKIPDFIKALKGGASLTVKKGDAVIEIEGEETNEDK